MKYWTLRTMQQLVASMLPMKYTRLFPLRKQDRNATAHGYISVLFQQSTMRDGFRVYVRKGYAIKESCLLAKLTYEEKLQLNELLKKLEAAREENTP